MSSSYSSPSRSGYSTRSTGTGASSYVSPGRYRSPSTGYNRSYGTRDLERSYTPSSSSYGSSFNSSSSLSSYHSSPSRSYLRNSSYSSYTSPASSSSLTPRSYLNSGSTYNSPSRSLKSSYSSSSRISSASLSPSLSPKSPHRMYTYSSVSNGGISDVDRPLTSHLTSTPKTERLDLCIGEPSEANLSPGPLSPTGSTKSKQSEDDKSSVSTTDSSSSVEKVDRSKWSDYLEPTPEDTGPVKFVSTDGRWVGDGFHPVDTVELTADRGYLLWTSPRGSIEVKFKYGKTGDDFRCFIDPQYQGVKIYELKGYKKEMIIDGREPVSKNKNPHHLPKSPARFRENNFEFRSRDGEVTLLLEACREYNAPKSQAFKFNYVLAL